MPKPMTEAQAFRKVGHIIEKAETMPSSCGLCREMRSLDIPYEWSYGSTRIKEHVDASATDDDDPAKWVYGEDWEARCLAAYFLALECEDEEKENKKVLSGKK